MSEHEKPDADERTKSDEASGDFAEGERTLPLEPEGDFAEGERHSPGPPRLREGTRRSQAGIGRLRRGRTHAAARAGR